MMVWYSNTPFHQFSCKNSKKSTPGLLWVNTAPNRYYSYNISLESAYCPLKEALWISVHPLHVYSMFPSPLKYQYCLLPAILLIPFLWVHPKSIYNRVEMGFSLPGPTNACRLVSPAKNFEPVTTNRFWKVKEKVDHIYCKYIIYSISSIKKTQLCQPLESLKCVSEIFLTDLFYAA